MKILKIWLVVPMMMIAWGAYAQDDNISNNEGSEVVDVNKSDAKAEKKAEKAMRKAEKEAKKAERKAKRKAAKAQSDAEWKSRQSYNSTRSDYEGIGESYRTSARGNQFWPTSSPSAGNFCGYSGGTFNVRSK